jgi:hypothetical protein
MTKEGTNNYASGTNKEYTRNKNLVQGTNHDYKRRNFKLALVKQIKTTEGTKN